MKVMAIVNGLDLTFGKVYDVVFSYDTVYDLNCDTKRYCRNKNFFIEISDKYLPWCEENGMEVGFESHNEFLFDHGVKPIDLKKLIEGEE